jgi:serine/threonine protein kinase
MAAKTFARFELLEEIGIGGMGLVFRAYDPGSERSVAIKVLPPEYIHDLGLRANFEREARLISALEHESIVPVLEFGAFEGQPYLVMPYMPGGSLAERLVQGSLSPQEINQVLERLANALDYTHQQGIVHRDLKPSNVLFDEYGRAFLADFGIALQDHAAWSVTGVVRGSPAYLSPEQALRSDAIDGRSDIYSLGIIVYEMLTGSRPFRGDASMVVVLKQIHDEPPLLRSINPEIPVALEEVILRALAKDVHDRYQTAGEFAAAFRQAINTSQAQMVAPDSGLGRAATPVSDPYPLTDPSQPANPDGPPPGRAIESPQQEEMQAQEAHSGWNAYHFLALGFVLWAGFFVGLASAAFIHRAQASTPPNLQLVIDQTGVTLTNISQASLDLAGLSFRLLSDSGQVVAEFQASQWDRIPESSKGILPAGACYQLLEPQSGNLSLISGTPQPRPPDCQNLVGWLAAVQPGWQFWLPISGETRFQVIQDGKVVGTCPVRVGQCEFSLAQP